MPSRCSELSVARSAVRGRRARGAFPYCGAGMDALEMVADWPVERAAVGVMAIDRTAPNGGTWAVVGIIGPHSERFRWASVTKPATALAVLVASEEGTLSLDDPAGPPGSTRRPTGGRPDLLERRLPGAGRPTRGEVRNCVRRLPLPGGARAARHGGHHARAGRAGRRRCRRAVGSAFGPAGAGTRAGRTRAHQRRDPSPGDVGPVPGPGRRAPGLPAVR